MTDSTEIASPQNPLNHKIPVLIYKRVTSLETVYITESTEIARKKTCPVLQHFNCPANWSFFYSEWDKAIIDMITKNLPAVLPNIIKIL